MNGVADIASQGVRDPCVPAYTILVAHCSGCVRRSFTVITSDLA